MLREELSRLTTVEERHHRLFARLLLAFLGSLLVFFAGTVLIWAFESGQKGSDIHGFGDAAFFTAVQLLTVSSSAKNPLSSGGKVLDVFLEIWAIFVVTAVAGSFASFFTSGDSNEACSSSRSVCLAVASRRRSGECSRGLFACGLRAGHG
jgi:hypothetical protein